MENQTALNKQVQSADITS